MSLLDIALLISIPVGTIAVTFTWQRRKSLKRKRGSRQLKLM